MFSNVYFRPFPSRVAPAELARPASIRLGPPADLTCQTSRPAESDRRASRHLRRLSRLDAPESLMHSV